MMSLSKSLSSRISKASDDQSRGGSVSPEPVLRMMAMTASEASMSNLQQTAEGILFSRKGARNPARPSCKNLLLYQTAALVVETYSH